MSQTTEERRLGRLATAMNRKAERLGIEGRVEAADLAIIMLAFPICPYCGIGLSGASGTFDHAVPLNDGGRNVRANIVRCCWSCQRQKFTKSVTEFEQYRLEERVCPVCGKTFKPRYADILRGYGKVDTRRCAAKLRWLDA